MTLGLGLGYDPTVAFTMVATGLVIVLVAIYILMNAACLGFFARRGMAGVQLAVDLVVPLLGIAAFVPAWLTAAGIKVFSFVTPLAPPLSYMGPGIAGFIPASTASRSSRGTEVSAPGRPDSQHDRGLQRGPGQVGALPDGEAVARRIFSARSASCWPLSHCRIRIMANSVQPGCRASASTSNVNRPRSWSTPSRRRAPACR